MSTFKKKIAAIVSSLIMAAGYSLIDYYLIPDDEIEPQTEQIDIDTLNTQNYDTTYYENQ